MSAEQERAAVVAWLRADNSKCDCRIAEGECTCGGWDGYKSRPLHQVADDIEAGAHLPTDRQALRDDITARYENTLRSLDDGWRPIESAPKDGTWVLGYWPTVCPQDRINTMQWYVSVFDGSYWMDAGNHLDWLEPTHWMPLPALPQDKRASALSDLAALDGETI